MSPYHSLSYPVHILLGVTAILLLVLAIFLFLLTVIMHFDWKYKTEAMILTLLSFYLSQGISDFSIQQETGIQFSDFFQKIVFLPWCVFVMVFLVLGGIAGYLFFLIIRKKKRSLMADALKESFDTLPDGVCFSSEEGHPFLVNMQINRLSSILTGKEILNANVFWDRLLNGSLQGQFKRIRQDPILLIEMEKNDVWEFRRNQCYLQGSLVYEITACDVTKQYRLSRELERRNESLREMNKQLRLYGKQVNQTVREQEILNTKIRIHDDVGRTLLASRSYLSQEKKTRRREELLRLWKDTISLLRKEAEPSEKSSNWELLQKASHAVGVKIVLQGMLPEKKKYRDILTAATYECLTNTVKHADGTELHVQIFYETAKIKIVFSNNGRPPFETIRETGGLSDLRQVVQNAGGEMEIQSIPRFLLCIEIPEGVKINEKEESNDCR